MVKLKLKNTNDAKQSPSANPSPKYTPSKAAETFANKWLYRFFKVNHELELAKHETEPDENNFDVEHDSHMRQLDAVGHTQELLIAFDEEATKSKLTMKTYMNKPITSNPFLIADDLRDFVFTFLGHWYKVKCEGWHGIPKGSPFVKVFITRLHVLWRENKNLEPLAEIKKKGGRAAWLPKGKQARPKGKGKKKDDSDEDSD